jgi:hypothetical protein
MWGCLTGYIDILIFYLRSIDPLVSTTVGYRTCQQYTCTDTYIHIVGVRNKTNSKWNTWVMFDLSYSLQTTVNTGKE